MLIFYLLNAVDMSKHHLLLYYNVWHVSTLFFAEIKRSVAADENYVWCIVDNTRNTENGKL